MERDGQLRLYDRLAARLKEAHTLVRTLPVSDEVRATLTRRLLVITAASKHDLADAERRLERFVADVRADHPPSEGRPDASG